LIDERSEWRTFSDKDKDTADPSRVGGPVNALLSDGGLSTVISGGKGVDKGLASSLQKVQSRTEGGSDRTLTMAFREIARVCGAMRLADSVKHQANEYFKEAQEKSKSVKSKGIAPAVAAVVFLACRQMGYPRTFKEICAFVPQAKFKDIGRMYKAIVSDLKLKETGEYRASVAAIHPESFLRRFMSQLMFSNSDMRNAIALANAMLPQDETAASVHEVWHGKNPNTIAGMIMLIISALPRASKRPSLETISKVCGVTEATIKGLYRESFSKLESLITLAGGFATPEEIQQLPTFDKSEKGEKVP
jgi:transcription initiation factor TFIIB